VHARLFEQYLEATAMLRAFTHSFVFMHTGLPVAKSSSKFVHDASLQDGLSCTPDRAFLRSARFAAAEVMRLLRAGCT
jgi:hypothetical protein